MNQQIILKLQSNLFPESHIAISDWEKFPWHLNSLENTDTYKPHSSQALAIDVFGTLKYHPGSAQILNAFVAELSLPPSDVWNVYLEWESPTNPLKEINKHTQVDAMAECWGNIIFFESKFTEPDGGVCSQIKPLTRGAHKGMVQCNGNYVLQSNPVNGIDSRCALTGKGIRYWDVIPEVFNIDPNCDYFPCPFAGPTYQWMRNITNAYAVAQERDYRAAFCLIYADREGLPVAEMVRSPRWQEFLSTVRSDRISVSHISYQEFLKLAIEADDHAIWRELKDWVERKIADVPLPTSKSK